MPTSDKTSVMPGETIRRESSTSSHHYRHHHRSGRKDRRSPQLPMRRPCPSAPLHRYWNQNSSAHTVGSNRAGVLGCEGLLSSVAAAASVPDATTSEPGSFLNAQPPLSSACVFVDCSTDSVTHTRTCTYPTAAGNVSNTERKKSEGVDVAHLPLFTLAAADTTTAPASSLSRSSRRELNGGARPAGSHPRSTDDLSDADERSTRCKSGAVWHSEIYPHSAPQASEAKDIEAATNVNSCTGSEEPLRKHCLSDSPAELSLKRLKEPLLVQVAHRLDVRLTEASASDKAQVAPPRLNLRSGKERETNSAEAGPHWQAAEADKQMPVRGAAVSEPRVVRSAKPPLSATPEIATSALSSNDQLADWMHSILSHSCSLTRLMQHHQLEGWKDELRNALQQDADAWVLQVCEEQQLLQSQLTFTQARVVELTQEVQLLRGNGPEHGITHSDLKNGKPFQPDGETNTGSPGYSGDAELPVHPGGAAGQQNDCDTKLDNRTTEATCSLAYKLEMETYIRSLEAHTRALHDEKQQLQLRLDRRTAQLASAQRRYEQSYALLLHEQEVLEADYQKATEDVEEVVGMLVVARAAEQAALRRLNEYEVALEEAEFRVNAMAAQEQRQQLQPHSQFDDGEEQAVNASAAQSLLRSQQPSSCLRLAQRPSTPGSTYYSCVEVNDRSAAATSTATFTPPCMPTDCHASLPALLSPSAHPSPFRGRCMDLVTGCEAVPPPHPCSTANSPSSSPSISFSGTPSLAGGPSSHVVQTLPALATAGLQAAESPSEDAPPSLPHSLAKSGGRLLSPIASSFAALRTPQGLAVRRSSGANTTATTLIPHHGCESCTKGANESPSEHELMRFKCTLLELELQAKEASHKEEREKWESAVHHAEAVCTCMGEVEARVRQATASSNRVTGLLHEMNRVWCTSLALEDQCDSEEDDMCEETRERSPLASIEEVRQLYPRPSRAAAASVSDSLRRNSLEGAFSSECKRSPENMGSGREFFGVEGRFVF
ncbi:hypothetical protein ABL78_8043 [Leptomonas seymouri]|uniref:Uncharacterized protein n=1 Tax=Leptomonas seymouri TaxID=5684 RepID=A0A0N1P9X5_LEPSE|nr:hypothetical protein ABL78_8043 [Leptomonas seymouri]|eukprot:KPI82941.1 hypothetical protein ABL78_8043 [Leptomonas seymouri]